MASCSAGVSFKKGEKTQYKVRREARIPIQSVIIASYIHTLGGIGSAQKSFFREGREEETIGQACVATFLGGGGGTVSEQRCMYPLQ